MPVIIACSASRIGARPNDRPDREATAHSRSPKGAVFAAGEGAWLKPGARVDRLASRGDTGRMSRENVEVVRQPLSLTAAPRRRIEEHLAVRCPRVLAFLLRAVMSLPPRSRLRRALIRRIVQQGIEAANRRDYESAFALYDPAVELLLPPGLTAIGFEPVVRGREERVRFEVRWRTEWGEYWYVPEELRDLGDRVLVVGRMKGSGPSSGAAFDNEWADVFTISAGRVVREHVFFDHAEAIEAAGLREASSLTDS